MTDHNTLRIPTLNTGNADVDRAFRIAVGDLASNIMALRDGLLKRPEPVILAGIFYDTMWTRDTAFNVWYAGGLLAPEVARNSLLAVLAEVDGRVEIGGQYWDKIIWALGAWQYRLHSGDTGFLTLAAEAVRNSLERAVEEEFDPADGLFRGAACFQDGVAAYPDKFVSKRWDSGVFHCAADQPEWFAAKGFGLPMKALSTNCLYLLAMELLDKMTDAAEWRVRAGELRAAIRRNFYRPEEDRLEYLLDAWDTRSRQEGLGYAFALLAGVLSAEEGARLIARHHKTPEGIACVWPQYERYALGEGVYGRHSGTVWPQVNAAWCSALAWTHHPQEAWFELERLALRASRDHEFFEIYHPETGARYGGVQERGVVGEIVEWESCRRQTWCATGYLHMVWTLLAGMRFDETGVELQPWLPPTMTELTLCALPYREAELHIHVTRGGDAPKQVRIPATAQGEVHIELSVE